MSGSVSGLSHFHLPVLVSELKCLLYKFELGSTEFNIPQRFLVCSHLFIFFFFVKLGNHFIRLLPHFPINSQVRPEIALTI